MRLSLGLDNTLIYTMYICIVKTESDISEFYCILDFKLSDCFLISHVHRNG